MATATAPRRIIAADPRPEMAAMGGTVYLCSVFPEELVAERWYLTPLAEPDAEGNTRSNKRHYVLPAGSPENPSVIKITNAPQYWPMPTVHPEDGSDTLTRGIQELPAGLILQSLMKEWALTKIDAADGFSIGIGPIAGPEPTPAEISALVDKQNRYFDHIIQLGNQHYQIGQTTHNAERLQNVLMPDTWYRKCAKHRGTETMWMSIEVAGDVRKCLNCGDSIGATAKGCRSCGTNLIRYVMENRDLIYPDLAAVEAEDPYLASRPEIQKMFSAPVKRGPGRPPKTKNDSDSSAS